MPCPARLACLLTGMLLPAAVSADPSQPSPPQQTAPWTQPAGLPGPLVSATATLFGEGLADPRGGDYRQVSVATGNVWSGDGGVVQVHGWALPAPAAGPRFAVCWNGLVYPAVSVGGPADLSADVSAMVKADAEVHAAHDRANPAEPYFRFVEGATPEQTSVSETSLLPIKAALLARLGEGGLTQKFWAAWLSGTPPRHNGDDQAPRDPYLTMADEWVWALFDRAVTAHMRGDDWLSLLSARQLTALQPVAEAEARRRGYKQAPNGSVHEASRPYFPYLDPLPRLLADEERRTADAPDRPALADILKMPDKPARIQALLGALDQVSARQEGQPGGVSPDGDPIAQALIAQGEDAVPPLLRTLATDTRLTRSVSFGRDFFQDRHPVSVAGTAYAALISILHTTEFSPAGSYEHPAEAAAAIQAYWDKYKGLSAAERWYRILADDKAAPAQWLDAAHEIIRPSDERVLGGWIERGLHPKEGVPPQGEALRRAHLPSVSELVAERTRALNTYSGAPDTDSRQFNDVGDATTMALYFTAWDPQAARPVLRDQFQTQRRSLAFWAKMRDVRSDARRLTALTLARMQVGDPATVTDYGDWLQSTAIKDLPPFDLSETFEPLWRTPNDPAARRAAELLFNDPHSPWSPLIQERPGYNVELFEGILDSPLLCLGAFRRAVLTSLADRTVVKTVTLGGPDRQADYNVIGNDQSLDPFRPATPQAFPVRRCDVYAWHLSRLGGMPAFQYDWPLAKKDAAVSLTADRLRRYGANFVPDLAPILPRILPGEGGYFPSPPPPLSFARLDRPATPQDVARNRAIFTLGVGTHVRPLPTFPLAARWMTDRRYPRHETVWTAPSTFQRVIGYAQDGLVWQSEEAADGRRFYGFVGPHDIARVPAEDVEFPPADANAWTQVSPALDCALSEGDGPGLPYVIVLGAGRPLPLTLHLRSRRGLAQTLPADFLRRQVALKLLYSADDAQATQRGPTDPTRTWEVVLPRRPLPAPSAPARTLEPAQDFTAWTVDPHDGFDLSRPGTYRLQFVFASASKVTGRQTPEAAFRVSP